MSSKHKSDVAESAYLRAANRRFDKRATFLLRFGFEHVMPEYPLTGSRRLSGTFVRKCPTLPNRLDDISTLAVLHSCAFSWRSVLRSRLTPACYVQRSFRELSQEWEKAFEA